MAASYSERKQFFGIFRKTLGRFSFQGILLTLFLTVLLNVDCIEEAFSRTYAHEGGDTGQWFWIIGNRWEGAFEIGIVCLIVVVSSLLLGLYAFRFLHTKKSVNVYFSLGLNRRTLFAGRFTACVVIQLFSVLIPFAVCGVGNSVLYGSSSGLWTAIAVYALTLCVYALLPLAWVALCMSLTGSTVEGILCGTVLTAAPSLAYYAVYCNSVMLLMGTAFDSMAYTMDGTEKVFSDFGSTFGFFDFVHPIASDTYTDALSPLSTGAVVFPKPYFILFYLALFVLASVLARLAFCRFKSEKAAFLGTSPRLLLLCIFFLGLFFVPIGCLLLGANGSSALLITVCSLLFIAAVMGIYLALIAVLLRSRKKIKAQRNNILCMGAGLFAFVLIFVFGGFGYEKRIPKTDEIESAAISIMCGQGAVVSEEFYLSNYDEGKYMTEGEWDTESFLQTVLPQHSLYGSNCMVYFDETQHIDTVRDIHKMLIEDERNRYSITWERQAMIAYKLKDGRIIARAYKELPASAALKIMSLLNSDDYREAVVKELQEKINSYVHLYNKDGSVKTNVSSVTGRYESNGDIIRALIADVQNGNMPMDLVSDSPLVCYIGLSNTNRVPQSTQETVYTWDFIYNDAGSDVRMIPVYACMIETLAELQAQGLRGYYQSETRKAVSAKVFANPLNAYGEEDYEKLYRSNFQFFGYHRIEAAVASLAPPWAQEVTDAAALRQIEENAYYTYFVNQPGYYVELQYAAGENEEQESVSLVYVPLAKMPESVVSAIESGQTAGDTESTAKQAVVTTTSVVSEVTK